MSEQYFTELNERVHRLEEQRPVISEIRNRIARLERTIEQVHNLEVSLAKMKDLETEHAAGHDGQVRLPPEIGEIIKNLDQPLEGVRRTFSCTRCGTKNRVAVHIKCTACDSNSWLGWWPERRPKAPATGAPVAPAAAGMPVAAVAGPAHVEAVRTPEAERALRADL